MLGLTKRALPPRLGFRDVSIHPPSAFCHSLRGMGLQMSEVHAQTLSVMKTRNAAC